MTSSQRADSPGGAGRWLRSRRFADSPISKAPAFLLLICWCVTLLLIVEYGFPVSVAIAAALLIASSWGLFGTASPNKNSLAFCLVLLPAALFGALYIAVTVTAPYDIPETVREIGVVTSEREWGYGRVAVAASDSGKYLLRLADGSSLREGDIVSFSGSAVRFKRAGESEGSSRSANGKSARNTFDELLYWRAKGVTCAIEKPETRTLGVSNGAARWREVLNRRIEETLPVRTAGYVMASWTGARDMGLDSLHRAVGTSHLLAVSGFHVGIVFGFCWLFFKRFKARLYIISVFIWLYVILAGSAPSALRSAVMIQVVILGRLLGRPSTGFNSVSFAGSAMLAVNPWLFWDLGWRLSMMSVLCITSVSSMPLIRALKESETLGKNGRADRVKHVSIVVSGVLVWLATALLSSWVFKETPVVGLFINFAAIPAFAVLLPAAFVLSLPALLGLPGGYAIASIAEFAFAMWERFSTNMLFFCPYQMPFSFVLLLTGSVVMTYFFANASGFTRSRASMAAAVAALVLLFNLLAPVAP